MKIGLLLVPAAVAVGAFVLLVGREPVGSSAFTLRVGDCFDVPSVASVAEVDVQSCTEPHDGEVFYVANDTTSTAWPGVEAFRTRVADECLSGAFAPYAGASYAARQDLKVGYFFPQADAWAAGQHRMTCYISPSDGSKAAKSVRATP